MDKKIDLSLDCIFLGHQLATAVQYTERLQDLESQFHAMTTSNQQRRSEHKMYMEHLDSQASELSSQLQAAGDELLPLKLGLPQTVFQGLEQLVSQRDQHINILSEEALKVIFAMDVLRI